MLAKYAGGKGVCADQILRFRPPDYGEFRDPFCGNCPFLWNTEAHRPQHLDEMVGQVEIKRKARIAIQAALQRGEPLPHVLLTSAGGGLGKTSFAQVLANEMFSPLVMTTGQCLASPSDLRRIMVSLEQNSVLLVDEFQNVARAAAEELLLVLEDRVLNINVGSNCAPLRIEVPPFTLIAASTEPESISAPLQQRFGLTFCFDFYAEMEIKQIIRETFTRWSMEIDDDAAITLAQRARGIPRVALRLSERVRDVAQAQGLPSINLETVTLTMKIEGIDLLGLSRHEQHLLRILNEAEPKAVSARSLSLALELQCRPACIRQPTNIQTHAAFMGERCKEPSLMTSF